jgi:hypothetical protein
MGAGTAKAGRDKALENRRPQGRPTTHPLPQAQGWEALSTGWHGHLPVSAGRPFALLCPSTLAELLTELETLGGRLDLVLDRLAVARPGEAGGVIRC